MSEILKRVFTGEIKSVDRGERTITALISTSSKDRVGDILDPKGVDLKNYNKNPVVLWAHDYVTPPIAKALWVRKTTDGVLSKMKFAKTEFASEIFELYAEGFMKAFSVGFISKESEPIDKDDDGPFSPRRFTKWELLEYSAVPVPANPEALSLAMTKGILKDKDLIKQMQKDEEKDDKMSPFDGIELKFYDKNGNALDFDYTVVDEEKWANITLNNYTPNLESLKTFDELVAENEQLNKTLDCLDKEIAELKYQLYCLLMEKSQKESSEIAVEDFGKKFAEAANGAIRELTGKVD